MRLASYHQWFEPHVKGWLEHAHEAAIKLIDTSVAVDDWEPVTARAFYSSSVVDVFRVSYEMLEVWIRINWPDPVVRQEVFFVTLAKSVGGCICRYIALVEAKARDSMMQDADATFFVPDAVCVAFNNISKVRTTLGELEQFLNVRCQNLGGCSSSSGSRPASYGTKRNPPPRCR